jgi:uncharacterized protein (UPF0147 family)
MMFVAALDSDMVANDPSVPLYNRTEGPIIG